MHNTLKRIIISAVVLSLLLASIASTISWVVGLDKITNKFSEPTFYLLLFGLLSIFFMLITVPCGILSCKYHLILVETKKCETSKKPEEDLQDLKDRLQGLKDDIVGLGFKIENTTGPLLRGILKQRSPVEIPIYNNID